MHGFTYGDGTLEGYNGHRGYGSRAYLFPPKDDAMRAWFGMHKMQTRKNDGRVIVFGLPRSFRSLPKLNEGASYLYGWLAGYFAADGTVSKGGQLELDSASYESLEHAQAVCDLLGIGTSTIRSYERDGRLEQINSTGVGCGVRPIHRMRLSGSDITPEFLLLPHHLTNFIAHKREYERTRWTVVDVHETDAIEEVYCCEVPETGSFAIDGNILTGNCKGCGRAGNLLELVKIGLPDQPVHHVEALRWLRDNFGEVARKPQGGSLTADLLARLEKARYVPPAPRLPNEAETIGPQGIFAVDWRSDHEAAVYMRGRCFAPEVLEDWNIGYDTWTQRVAIPVRDETGLLVGFKGRAISDGVMAKYSLLGDTEDRAPRYGVGYGFDMHDACKVVFGLDRALAMTVGQRPRRVALVEGELNVIATIAAGRPAGAPGTTSITDEQLWLLRAHFDELVMLYDSDEAGCGAVWGRHDPNGRFYPGLVEKISPYFRLYDADDHEGDPATMAPEQIRALVDGAKHWLHYAVPSGAGI
jgi:DNA primase